MPNSTTRALVTFIGAMLAILAVLLAASIGGIATVDILRSYASGGTHYAKGHMSAVAALYRYGETGAAQHLHLYRRNIHVTLSDGLAREVLEQPDLSIANSYPFLIAGKNHPEDVAGIAWLFRMFGSTPMFEPAIAVWREADGEIERLDRLADRLHRSWVEAPADAAARILLLREIQDIDEKLLTLEDRFAWQLGEAARSIAYMLYTGLAALVAVLVALVVALGARTHRRLMLAQRAIQDREERFRDVADLAADWIWETDADLRFSYFSDRLEQAIGVPKETLLGRTRPDIAHVEDTAAWDRHYSDLVTRRAFQGFEYAYRDPSGGLRHFRINGKPVFDASGRFIGYRGTGTDVTKEVTTRRELAANNALLQTIFENMSQGISVVGVDLRVLAFNERFLDLLGFPRDRFKIGDPFEAFVRYNAERGEYGDVDVEAYVANLVAAARRFEPHVLERIRPDGTVLEVRGLPLPTGGFVTTYTDITELRRATRELQAAMITAETANQAKSAFLANMSHELRTPLNAVIGFADLMAEERFGPLSERYVGYARDIRQSGQHLLAVINDILDITRVEAGKIELSVEAVEPHHAVSGCFRMLRERAFEAGITLSNEIPADAPPLHADPQRLRQVILNLVGNAIKFSSAGGKVVVRYIEAETGNGLQVVDRGIGIPVDLIDSAFEPFAQLHNGFDRKYDGAGLGLPLVRRFMELHGGTASIESQEGSGTTVTVLFPRHADRDQQPVASMRAAARLRDQLPGAAAGIGRTIA